jgi:ankyrin repeat protein
MSPLFAASIGGYVSCVEALIGSKADVLQCDYEGISPAQIALEEGHSDCVAALVRAGAEPPGASEESSSDESRDSSELD